MNEREAEKFVKKDNVWKKPDYAVMLEEGIPLGVVYFIKKARDGLTFFFGIALQLLRQLSMLCL